MSYNFTVVFAAIVGLSLTGAVQSAAQPAPYRLFYPTSSSTQIRPIDGKWEPTDVTHTENTFVASVNGEIFMNNNDWQPMAMLYKLAENTQFRANFISGMIYTRENSPAPVAHIRFEAIEYVPTQVLQRLAQRMEAEIAAANPPYPLSVVDSIREFYYVEGTETVRNGVVLVAGAAAYRYHVDNQDRYIWRPSLFIVDLETLEPIRYWMFFESDTNRGEGFFTCIKMANLSDSPTTLPVVVAGGYINDISNADDLLTMQCRLDDLVWNNANMSVKTHDNALYSDHDRINGIDVRFRNAGSPPDYSVVICGQTNQGAMNTAESFAALLSSSNIIQQCYTKASKDFNVETFSGWPNRATAVSFGTHLERLESTNNDLVVLGTNADSIGIFGDVYLAKFVLGAALAFDTDLAYRTAPFPTLYRTSSGRSIKGRRITPPGEFEYTFIASAKRISTSRIHTIFSQADDITAPNFYKFYPLESTVSSEGIRHTPNAVGSNTFWALANSNFGQRDCGSSAPPNSGPFRVWKAYSVGNFGDGTGNCLIEKNLKLSGCEGCWAEKKFENKTEALPARRAFSYRTLTDCNVDQCGEEQP